MLLIIALFPASTKAEEQIRSSSLRVTITRNGNEERLDYVNEQGDITYAADKRYATVIISKGNHSQTEAYYDTEGNPAKQQLGHYAVRREYDEKGRNWKVTFLGTDRMPVMTSNGYACFVRTFDDNGNIITEHYYDEQGNPVNTNAYGYGCYKEYDQCNRNVLIAYLGEDEKPVITTQGFAIVHRIFYEDGESEGYVKEEYYFDQNHNPTVLLNGQSGLHKEYDQYGRAAALTYLDADGNAIITREGYTTIKRTYYDNDSIQSEMYYDQEGKPIGLSEGQYGIRYQNEGIIYLDHDGNEQFSFRMIMQNHPVTVIILMLGAVLASVSCGRKANVLLLLLYLSANIYLTLLYRTGMDSGAYSILVSANRDATAHHLLSKGMIYNILLFVPLGTILYRLYPGKRILLVPVVLSVLIELVQFVLRIGLPEVNDVICNSLGALLGYSAGNGLTKLIRLMKIRMNSRQTRHA